MKRHIIYSIIAVLLPLSVWAQNAPVMGTLLLNGKNIQAEYTVSGGKASLGSGRNACISHYSQGRVIVPKEITVGGTTYPVTAVSPMAFRLCNGINYVQLPEGVTHIGNFAFKGCVSLQVVVLPSTLESIGSGAFVGLNLYGIYCQATTPPRWEYNDVFCRHEGGIGSTHTYSNTTTTLYVPEVSKEAYEQSEFSDTNLGWTTPDGWKYFRNVKGTNDYETEWGLGISTLPALNSFRNRVNSGEDFTGKTVKVEADIDMTTEVWDSGIGGGGANPAYRHSFKGTFDGQGHTISNLSININDSNSDILDLGFFRYVDNGTVTNLRIDNFSLISQSKNTNAAGIVAAMSTGGTFSNIYVSNSSVHCFGDVGGLVGLATLTEFNKCVVDHISVIHTGDYSNYGNGGLVGFSQGASIRNCAVINGSRLSGESIPCIKGPFVGRSTSGTSIDFCYTDADQFKKFVPTENDNGYTHGDHVMVLGQRIWFSVTQQYIDLNIALIKNFMILVPILGLDNWVYCVGEYSLPDCFEDRYEVGVNKFSLRPATLTTPRPNALSLASELNDEDWASGKYRTASFKTSSLWIDDNLDAENRQQIPIGTATIECTNGVRYDRTLTAPENGTRTMQYPVYLTDEDNLIVLDENGQRIPTGETIEVEEPVYQPTPYSFCLPYELTFSSNVHLFKPTYVTQIGTSSDEAQVIFEGIDNGVAKAWTPYYALVESDNVPLSTEEHVTVVPNTQITIDAGKANFEGTAATTLRSTKDAYLLQEDKTWRKEGDVIPPFRAYFYSSLLSGVECLKPFIGIELHDASENSLVLEKHDGLTLDVSIEGRTINRSGSWITLCLPFDLTDFSGTPLEGATVKTLASSSFDSKTGTLTLNFEEVTSIKAGKPYILRWKRNDKPIKKPTFTNVTINKQAKSIKTDAVTFCGIFDPFLLEANDKTKLYLSSSNTLYYPGEEMYVNSFRAYFQLAEGITAGNPAHEEQGVKAFVLNFDDGQATEIISIPAPSQNGEEWYDTTGRRLNGKPVQKGVYIKNGRSVVIK